ncbi:MAG: hypothetical protein V1781_08300 [Bacteroidota bacterium]
MNIDYLPACADGRQVVSRSRTIDYWTYIEVCFITNLLLINKLVNFLSESLWQNYLFLRKS